MPVSVDTYEGGDAMVAADVNADYTAIAAETAILDDENTRTEWCSRGHISQAGNATFNLNFAQVEDSNTTQVINTNVFTQVNLVPAFRIAYGGLVLQPGEVLRCHFDINAVAATILNPAGTPGYLANDDSDCYQFRFFFRNFVSGVESGFGPTATYSTTNKGTTVPPSTGIQSVNRIGQRCSLHNCFLNATAAAISFDWIEVRARVCDTAYLTSVSIKDGTFQVFRALH
jgi:hypothetical protein